MYVVGHNPETRWLDSDGNPDLEPDPGIFWRNFTIPTWAMVKAFQRGFGNSPNIC